MKNKFIIESNDFVEVSVNGIAGGNFIQEQINFIRQKIKEKATTYVKNQLKELDYDNEGEVALYASNIQSKWYDEAKKLQIWIEDIYVKMYKLMDSITSKNYQDIDLDKMEEEYPKFKRD